MSKTHLNNIEREILQGYVAGLTGQEIGRKMFISNASVSNYLRLARAKLGARTAHQAVAIYVAQGLHYEGTSE
jgi:DNA-binding CsgD family transcriptional regulator